MERISLYYPAINVPDGNWLRNSLLYNDKVASIFPFNDLNDNRVNDDTRILYNEGQYLPIEVFNELTPFHNQFSKFEQNFIEAIESKEFKKVQGQLRNYDTQEYRAIGNYNLYVNKLTRNISEFLKEKNLLTPSHYNEVSVEKTSAIVYMSMLADYLACINTNLVIPSTDQVEFEKLAFQLADKKIKTNKLQIENCLPVPSPNVSIEQIIKFKNKRKQELLKFRTEIDELERNLNKAESDEERKIKMIQFSEKIQIGLIDLKKLLGDSKLDYVLNGFSSLLDFKQKEIVGTVTGLGVAGAGVVSSLPLVGIGAGAVLLTGTLISSYRKINRQISANSLSYVYYAQKERILKK